MNSMDAQKQEKAIQMLNDANVALTKLMTVLVHVQANIGSATAALGEIAANNAAPASSSDGVHDLAAVQQSIKNAVSSMSDLTDRVLGQTQKSPEPVAQPVQEAESDLPLVLHVEADPDMPTLVVHVADEPAKVEPIDKGILTFGKLAKQVLSPRIIMGGRGFLEPSTYRDSLFMGDASANLKRILKWQTGFYNTGNELMLHTTSFAIVYPRLEQHDSIDIVEPIIFFKRKDVPTGQSTATLHFIETMDRPTLAILLEELRNEFSRAEETTI